MIIRAFILILFFCLTAVPVSLPAQEQPSLFYFLPQGTYNPAVPKPADYLGFEVGERHASHDQLVGYMRELVRTSNRLQWKEYGRTQENRPLICLTISHPDNLARIETIRQKRRELADPALSAQLNPADFPAVFYMGYSIHGNEASGSNAALAVAYWLAAAQGDEVEEILRNTVILFDPCFNPDGMQRFSSWVNSRRPAHLQPDPASDEFNEHWPGGRFNHYWFDLNRDWLVMQQPESEGRVRIFQDWLPNVLTDHHEMGSNSTFFFQPGVPSRVNPVTPLRNQQLTGEIAQYHVKALSEKGILFYSGENYDDFYYGKGSTYPDANGSIGILFEQGSSRGSAQETTNGLLTFAYSVRNHVLTSFSTLRAVHDKRVELNNYLREFYQTAREEARKSGVKAYVLQAPGADASGLQELAGRIFSIHHIQFYALTTDITVDGKIFTAGKALVVPVDQNQYRLVRAVFERNTHFADSIFYDISAWTLPDAFGLQWAPLDNRQADAWKGLKPWPVADPKSVVVSDSTIYAYIIPADAENIDALLTQLHQNRFRVKVATQPFTTQGRDFAPGTLVVTTDRQTGNLKALKTILNLSAAAGQYIAVQNGATEQGPWLGSNSFVSCQAPKVVLVTGDGVSPTDAGEICHYLDTRLGIPPVEVETARLKNINLSKYNVLILPDGKYDNIPVDNIKEFVNNGGTLIATGGALRWLKTAGIANLEFKTAAPSPGIDNKQMPFGDRADTQAARTMPGSIFSATIDPTHPLCYGFHPGTIPVFMPDALYVEPSSNGYQNPVLLTKEPLLAGYIHPSQVSAVSGAAAATTVLMGSGRIICFAINPNFRGFWWGTQRLMGNAVLFGNLVR